MNPVRNPVLARWSSLDPIAAAREILPCCGSQAWAAEMAARRPFADIDAVLSVADTVWMGLPESAWDEAFASHPRIGQQRPGGDATPEALEWSRAEQTAAASQDGAVQDALVEGNRRYEERFGRIFIVCAQGRAATEILALLEKRLGNDPRVELLEAVEEQRRIMQLRLHKWLNAREDRGTMSISTHILDTATGTPAAEVPLSLARWQNNDWELLQAAATDADGRCRQLLADERFEPGIYRVRFDTAAYYEAKGLEGLYPYVDVVFEVRPGQAQYHIPLLLTANGYTTYRGS
jgi:2-oxo-4-hydroxy-4-carboxy-5-ureidoimidazoline decarboxylase